MDTDKVLNLLRTTNHSHLGNDESIDAIEEIITLRAQLTEAQNARADTLAENGKLNDALGQIHILCSDAGIDPGNVVDRVRELADKVQKSNGRR